MFSANVSGSWTNFNSDSQSPFRPSMQTENGKQNTYNQATKKPIGQPIIRRASNHSIAHNRPGHIFAIATVGLRRRRCKIYSTRKHQPKSFTFLRADSQFNSRWRFAKFAASLQHTRSTQLLYSELCLLLLLLLLLLRGFIERRIAQRPQVLRPTSRASFKLNSLLATCCK